MLTNAWIVKSAVDCIYRQNSISEVLPEDVKLGIYFRFKVLNTL